ncbi:MAG: nickel pincer cofactor biosynthesis protein LarB [Candidatus Bathyarchaeia archaeon]
MREVLQKLIDGSITLDEAEKQLRMNAIIEVGSLAKIDVNRQVRKGIPEIILAEGKSPGDVARIALEAVSRSGRTIVSRASLDVAEVVRAAAPPDISVEFREAARIILLKSRGSQPEQTGGRVGVLTAGTSDIPVAEEAKAVAEEMGCTVISAYDVGVAGIHRLFPSLKRMVEEDVDIIVAIAGREGAMASVVAGIVDVPVVGVPTSSGYGFGEKGLSALMAMLQACSLGLAVVNIDGGVAAGTFAALIANRIAEARRCKEERGEGPLEAHR